MATNYWTPPSLSLVVQTPVVPVARDGQIRYQQFSVVKGPFHWGAYGTVDRFVVRQHVGSAPDDLPIVAVHSFDAQHDAVNYAAELLAGVM